MKTHFLLSVRPGLFLLISAVCLMLSCKHKSDTIKNDLKELQLKGEVKSLTEITYDAVNRSGEIQKGERQFTRKRLFNDKGFVIEDGYFDAYLNVWNKSTYSFDKESRLTELKRMNNEGELMSKITSVYDEEGRIIERIRMNYLVKSQEKEIFKYSGDGREVEMEFRLFGGVEQAVYYLNEIEKKTTKEDSRFMGNRYRKEIYIYDERGNKIEEKHLTSKSTLTTRKIFTYDISGNLTETKVFDSGGSLIWINKFRYDLLGNETEKQSGSSDFELNVDKICQYDKMGNKLEEINALGHRKIKTVFNYIRFDEKGNWINRTISNVDLNTGEELSANYIAREIEYY